MQAVESFEILFRKKRGATRVAQSLTTGTCQDPGLITRREIFQQPSCWLDTAERVEARKARGLDLSGRIYLTGAGSSAHAATAIAASWPGSTAIPSTDLLLEGIPDVPHGALLISLARSGDSPESAAVIEKLQRESPGLRHLAVTCNADGRLAHWAGVDVIVLDPRTNDRSLAMTSSFSNLLLAGVCLGNGELISSSLAAISERAAGCLPRLDETARSIAAITRERIAILAPPVLTGVAREASLKILELTGGRIVTMCETYLGLRHGPLSFLREDTITLCLVSANEQARLYETDLLCELRGKRLGRLVGIVPEGLSAHLFDEVVPALASDAPDSLRAPFEILFAQLLAYHLSLRFGLNPDNPSPDGIINRVVQGVRIHR
jgi:tagatose-6-phosphate ketose/aldose isomerase